MIAPAALPIAAAAPTRKTLRILPTLLLLLVTVIPRTAEPYSLQTHQQLIDLTWQHSIRPLLLSRYPNLTPAQLLDAHAYAYGGCAIQDLGYYPFGKSFFSDLAHYVRSGDFIIALFRNSHNANELAFSVGALSHYISDNIGHAEAVNSSVPIEFPKLGQQFGNSVPYADGSHAHVRTEFAFDINEIAKHRFAPAKYVEHIGLRVPQPMLETAFFQTYGLDMRRALRFKRPVIKGYRFGVRSFIPSIAYAEALLHKNSFQPDTPGEPIERLKADLTHAERDNHWADYRRAPGFGTHLLAGLIFITPKIGVASDFAIKGPTSQTEEKYVDSLNHSVDVLRRTLRSFSTLPTSLPNRDLDTGIRVRPGGYILTDQTYAKLLDILIEQSIKKPRQIIPLGLKEDILSYYEDPNAPIATKKDPKKWARVQAELIALNAIHATPNPPFTPGPDPDADENDPPVTTPPSTN